MQPAQAYRPRLTKKELPPRLRLLEFLAQISSHLQMS
jgi:hypothetical protein